MSWAAQRKPAAPAVPSNKPLAKRGKYDGFPAWSGGLPNFFFDQLPMILPAAHWRCLLITWRNIVEPDGNCEGERSLGRIADQAGVSRRVAAETVSWCCKAGVWQVRERGYRKTNVIVLNLGFDRARVAGTLEALVEKHLASCAARRKRSTTSATDALVSDQDSIPPKGSECDGRTSTGATDAPMSAATSATDALLKEREERNTSTDQTNRPVETNESTPAPAPRRGEEDDEELKGRPEYAANLRRTLPFLKEAAGAARSET